MTQEILCPTTESRLVLRPENLDRTIARLAAPAILESVLSMAIGTTTTLLIGWLRDDVALAAVGLTTLLVWIADGLFQASGIAATAMVARFLGRGDPEMAKRVAAQALLLGVLAALLATVVLIPLVDDILRLMGGSPGVVEQGTRYMRVILLTSVFSFPVAVASGVMRGAGDTRTPMLVVLVMNLWNAVASYLLVFGGGPVPMLGLRGAAIAVSSARTLGGFLMLGALFTGFGGIRLSPRLLLRWDGDLAARLLRLAFPNLGEQAVQRVGYVLFMRIIASLGTAALAAHQIAVQVESVSFMSGWGFAMAASTLTGQALGAGQVDMAEKSVRRILLFSCSFMGLMGLLFAGAGPQIVRVFGATPQVLALAGVALQVSALGQWGMAISMGLSGSLRGAGDTRTPLYVSLFGVLCFRVAVVYLFAVVFGWGLPGVWGAMTVDWSGRAILIVFLFRRGRWKTVEV